LHLIFISLKKQKSVMTKTRLYGIT